MLRTSDAQDRLYLSMGDQNIYLDNYKTPQHHIDGIRFLFRQFSRKNPGVIINDPFGYGRNIQVILFLKAIRRLLVKPILILCPEGTEHSWVERFHTLTDLYDEVIIEMSTNPIIKKMIIINTMMNLPSYCKREWSILIVDGDKNASVDQVLQLPFRADFKIWNTPINMKEDLDTFSDIYKWLYPKETFDKQYFIPNLDNPIDCFEKSVLLDSFMDDIVIRRDDLSSSFEKYRKDVAMPPPKVTPVVSKKNKDATGTKIKRSKVKTDNVTENINKPDITPELQSVSMTDLSGETSKTDEIYESTEDFSIDNFKRKNKRSYDDVLKEEQESPFHVVVEIDSDSDNRSDLKLYYEPDISTDTSDQKLVEMDTLSFGNDISNSQSFSIKEPKNRDSTVNKKENILEPKLVQETIKQFKPEDKYSSGNTESIVSDDSILTASIKKVSNTDNGREKLMPNNDRNIHLDELHREIRYMGTKEDKTEQIKPDIKSNEVITKIEDDKSLLPKVDHENNSGTKQIKSEHDNNSLKCNEMEPKIEINSESLRLKVNELSEEASEMHSEQINVLKRNNIDDKMKEYEEKVSKKFKGSFLDSLF